ncbi:phage/plasmid primase, P4 family [Sphingomonas jaspsi]|uniref:phage/plasmid primase, P4 family n=1 Tax=Sphingomonas jaspsi TaxID=392409 RepID=UPI0004BA1F69|nr:phage/plasmid primase, P4 family [Sphingomonas jaspsi]
MSNVFREFAPLYWEAGLPAMPLKVRSKAPILSEWTQYGTNMPSAAVRGHWLETYPRSNIGLPFGPASGLCAIDIDTTDPELVEIIEDCLPMTPWRRVGAKGCALIYRWQGQKNFKIRSDEGMICEFLGLGNQMVLPPSIHPDTGEAYTANTNLWEVMDKIPVLPVTIETQLREALGVKGGVSLAHEGRSKPLDVVPAGERDIQLVRHAGYLARVVFGLDKNEKWSLSEAMQHMHHWVENFTAGVAGDDMDPQKGIAKLLEFLLKDIEGGRTLPEGWDAGLTEEQLAHPTIAAIAEKNKAERWTFSRARDWINEQVSAKPADDDWALTKVEELVAQVAKDEQFAEHHFDALIPVLVNALGAVKMSKPALKKMFVMARVGSGDGAAEDHEAIARMVIEDISRGGELRHDQGAFWQWNGSCFGMLDDNDIYRHIAERVKGNALARRHNDYASIVKTISALVNMPLEENPELGINFANGFLDMSLQLHDHAPHFGKTFTLPFNYIPERRHECHRFLGMLESAWGDDADYNEKVAALQEVIAATMFGIAPEYQRAILLYGPGKTGKSQVLEILDAMMPDNAVCALPPHKWGERFALTALVGKVLNVCGELPEDAMIAGERFKGIVCGERQDTEYKGKDGFTFPPMAAHWFASNHLPRSRDTSDGFIRRWIIFEFTRKVPESERILNFAEVVISEEREAIAAWAVDGLKRLLEQREYTLPKSHKRLENLVLRSNNSVAAFLQSCERVRPDEASVADCRTVFDQYLFYMKDVSRGMGVTFERFKTMLEGLGYRVIEYQDEMLVTRDKVVGLKVTVPTLAKAA